MAHKTRKGEVFNDFPQWTGARQQFQQRHTAPFTVQFNFRASFRLWKLALALAFVMALAVAAEILFDRLVGL